MSSQYDELSPGVPMDTSTHPETQGMYDPLISSILQGGLARPSFKKSKTPPKQY